MNFWTRRRTLLTGITLILAVNALALAGVFYNRSGEPESLLRLSQRELRLPYRGWANGAENSGVELSLIWRVAATDALGDSYYGSYGHHAEWLDKAKLAALGFDVSRGTGDADKTPHLQQSKTVLLVLELNGPAYQRVLERSRKNAQQKEELSTANADEKGLAQQAKAAREQTMREAQENSRLFVVDAGLDRDVLRAQYPDRSHYLIVNGRIRPQIVGHEKERHLSGTVTGLGVSQINVPVAFQRPLKRATPNPQANWNSPSVRFEADIAFGKRLEPWLVGLVEPSEAK